MTVNTLAANQPVAIDVAQNLLLESHDLSTVQVESVLGHIMQSQVDDADIYFQSTRSEGWSLEEGIVKAGSFSIDQGVGVRAISGEKTAFAYSDDVSLPSLKSASAAVREIGASGGAQATGTALQSSGPSASYAGRVMARVRPNIRPPKDFPRELVTDVLVRLGPDGTIFSATVRRGSGNAEWDEWAVRAVLATAKLPLDTDGTVPKEMVIGIRPNE